MNNFIRAKQVVFTNNKWWVGKTSICYNVWKYFASQWYKTVLVDLDPQCNLSIQTFWKKFYEDKIRKNSIYEVLEWLIEWGRDINENIDFINIDENLSILPWSINLNYYEELLVNSSFWMASQWQQRGFFDISAINRFLRKKSLEHNIDIIIIDTSPNLWLLNRTIFLGADYFIVPTTPDIFSLEWIKNLWKIMFEWKRMWNNTALAMKDLKDISSNLILKWDAVFLWYIINSYNVYWQKPIKTHQKWIEEMKKEVKENLSYKHCKNWLVEISYNKEIWRFQDYWKLSSLSQEKNKAIFEFSKSEIENFWTKENLEKAKKEIIWVYEEIVERINKW